MATLTPRPTPPRPGPRAVDPAELARLERHSPESVLAAIRFGDTPAGDRPWLEAPLPNARLSPAPVAEVWFASGPVRPVAIEGARAVHDGAALFAAFELSGIDSGTLEDQTRRAYAALLEGIERAGYPHLIRIWNFVPGINDRSSGLERYMLFCNGRAEAFAARHGSGLAGRVPAASAVGTVGDALIVHAVAAKEPGRHVENPRQVAAYRYPPRYGPKSPSFARATVPAAPWPGALFVSGTASIVGHESVHLGDPGRQTGETMSNIEAVLDAAGFPGASEPLGPRLDALRVYVRHPEDAEAVRRVVSRIVGPDLPTVWLQADICREELLVEIEATVLPPIR